MNLREAKHRQQIILWKERVAACRTSGLSVKAWCAQEGCCTKTYYRWEEEILGLLKAPSTVQQIGLQPGQNAMVPVFEEVPPAIAQGTMETNTVIATVHIGRSSVELYAGADAEIVSAIMKGLCRAK